jgi:colanic acid/amylovoran biosynthesis glycosyltransferase
VAISEYHEKFLREKHADVRIEVVRNGLDLQSFPWQGERLAGGGPLRLLAIGRLIEKKGVDDLIEACALLRERGQDVDCRIVGEGDDRDALQERIERLGLQGSCTLQGACTQDELPGYLAWAAALAAPCVTAESGDKDGLPTVILEAMAAGLPVVSTPVTAIPEIVRHEETGLLVPERDPAALASAFQRLGDDHSFARRLAKEGRAAIEELHDNRKSGSRLAALYREASRCR